MVTKKSKSTEPVVTRGSHSTRTEYPNGRVEFETHWDELKRDVETALKEYAEQLSVTAPTKKTTSRVTTKKAK